MVQWDWRWPVTQLGHKSNVAQSDSVLVDNARGMCFTDVSSELLANATDETTGRLAWCRDYGGLSFSERCNGHGWHLQYRNRRDHYPTFVDMDCRCDSGWSGKRCHAPCFRRSSSDICELASTGNDCDRPGFKRSSIYNNVCEPDGLFIIPVTTKFFVRPYSDQTIFQVGQWKPNYFTDTIYAQADSPQTYAEPVCFMDRNHFKLPTSLSPESDRAFNKIWRVPDQINSYLCEYSFLRTGVVPGVSFPSVWQRWRRFVPLEFITLSSANYDCTPGSPRNSSVTPCPYGTNPTINPLHLNEPAVGPIQSPLNYNNFGIDRRIMWTISILSIDQSAWSYEFRGAPQYEMAEPLFPARIPLSRGCIVATSRFNRVTVSGCSNPVDRYWDYTCYRGFGFCPMALRCKSTQVIVANYTEPCAPLVCPLGRAGANCEIICDACNTDQYCNEGLQGDGKCKCNNPIEFVVEATGLCSSQGCGNPNNVCSGVGTCIQNQIASYCSCNAGYDGAACQNARTAPAYVSLPGSSVFDECDCSVVWANYVLVDRSNPLPVGLLILSDWSPALAPLSFPVLKNGIVNVGSSDQAKQLCHKDALCVGFALHILTDYWRQSNQPDAGIAVYRAYFLYQGPTTNAPINAGIVFPTGIAIEFHRVSRFEGYACASSVLQAQPWYFNTYYATVQPYCQNLLANYAARFPTAQPISQSTACNSVAMFTSHWRYQGHLSRLQPNPTCVLQPTLYSQESYCKGSRCPTNGNVPCSGVGICSQASNGQYVCSCEKFSSATSTGALGLNGNPRFLGNSCQFSVSTLCVQPQAATICSDNPSRCRPRLVFNSNFYNGDSLDATNSTDYIPFCDCSGTNLQGTYCEQSRCGVLSGACKSLSASAGDCVLINSARQLYQCVCQKDAIGQYCEIDARTCLNQALQLKCSAQGDCLPPDINHPDPWCNCRNGAFGQFCENSDCPEDVMVPGHGICVNRQLQRCYDTYQGSRCEIDRCALFDGQVIVDQSGLPSGCTCNRNRWSNLFQNQTVASCWPQCPELDGFVCGRYDRLPHECNQNELNGQRYARCVCAEGYIQVDHPTIIGEKVCEKYCKNGDVPRNWDPSNPSPCVCSASTGFDILDNSPRCDHPICANQGVYDASRGQCICKPPYSPFNKCITNVCGANNGVALWTEPGATSPYRCQCNGPYRSKFPDAPFDCAGTACGINGYLNPFFSSQSSPSNVCICVGRWRSNCTSLANTCAYCSTTTCLNNGIALQQDPSRCMCPTPYFNGPLGICELDACAKNNQTRTIANGQCVCTLGFQGPLCEQSICENNGVYNVFSGRCTCPSTAAGYFCEVLLIDYFPQQPTSGSSTAQIIARSSSTGTASPVQPTPTPIRSSSTSNWKTSSMSFWLLLQCCVSMWLAF